MTLRVFKCPYCGYRFRDDPEKRRQTGEAKITKGPGASAPALAGHKRTVDLTCPNCEQDFEVEVEG
jgi:sarcosine oxidase delta subunit